MRVLEVDRASLFLFNFFFRFFLQSHSFTKQQNFSKFGNGPTDANGIFFFLGKLPDLVAGPALRHSQTQNGTFVELELSDLHLLTCWCLAHRCRTNRQLFFAKFWPPEETKIRRFGCAKLKLTGWLNHTFASFVHSTTVAFIQPDATVLPSTHQTKLAKNWKKSKNSCSKREISRVRKKSESDTDALPRVTKLRPFNKKKKSQSRDRLRQSRADANEHLQRG